MPMAYKFVPNNPYMNHKDIVQLFRLPLYEASIITGINSKELTDMARCQGYLKWPGIHHGNQRCVYHTTDKSAVLMHFMVTTPKNNAKEDDERKMHDKMDINKLIN